MYFASVTLDVTLPDKVFAEQIRLQNILSIKADLVEIILGSSVCCSKKSDQSVSTKLFTESQSSHVNKSILKSTRRKIFCEDSFCKMCCLLFPIILDLSIH